MSRKARPATVTEIQKSPTYGDRQEQNNRTAMRALVIGDAPIKKEVGQSNAMTNDPNMTALNDTNVIPPPYDKLILAQLLENSSELPQCVQAMEINIEGFGGRLISPIPEEIQAKKKGELDKEKQELRRFLAGINPDYDLIHLRRRTRVDIETTGEAFWELVPVTGNAEMVSYVNHIESHTMFLLKQDNDFTLIKRKLIDPENGEVFEKTYYKRFRRFVQRRNAKKIYFKEWGDPRIVDRRTGIAYENIDAAKKADAQFDPKEHQATPILHFRLYSARTPYGMPRFIGNLFSIFGSRAAEEVNWTTFQNNNIPAMAVLVSGNAMLTDGTIKRIEEFSHNVMARNKNYSKFLIVEAEPAQEGVINSGTSKVEVVPLANTQHKDQLFQDYDKNNADKVRRSFRLPPIFVGKSEDYTRATAESSRRLADEQVFQPEREEMDRRISGLIRDMGFVYWTYKSFGPNVTDDGDLVAILNGTEKTGALTPNLARKVLGDILNQELPPYKESEVGFNPDVPFSLTMAHAVKGEGSLGGNPSTGALAPNQGQVPGVPAAVTAALERPNLTTSIPVLKEWRAFLQSFLEPGV